MRGFTTLIAGALIVGAWLVWHTTDATPDSAVVPASARTDGRLDGAFESGQPIGRPPATPARTAAAGISCVVKHLPSGAPASGAVRIGTASFPLVDGRCSVPQGSLASLLQEPPSLIPDALPGPPGTAQRPLRLRVARETSTQVELSAPDGWYVTATLSGMDLPHARVWIGAGSHTRTTSQPPDHDHDHEAAEDLTVDPRSFQPAELIGDRLTPLWIDDADAFVLAVVGPGGVLQETIAPPSAPVGHLVDLGAIDVPAAPGLRITVRSATGSDPDIDRDMHRDDMHRDYDDASFALDYARIPDPATPSFDAALALRHADPDLADFVLHDARLEISTHRPLLLSPLPSDPHAQLSLIAPSGLRAHPVVIALQTGRVTDVILDVAELFPNGTKGVSLRGLVHWVHDGTSVRSGRVEMTRPPRSVHLDQEGRFSIGAVPEGTRASLRLVGFDPEAPDRIERLTVQALQMAGTPDMEIRWKIAPSSVIRARGLPSGAPPLAFALQRHTEDRGFISTNLESATPTPDGVDIRAKSGDVYRVVACWSGVFQQMTGPVELSANGADAAAVFDPVSASRFIRGRVVDPSGAPIPNATIEITGSIGALPPIVVQADGSGLFSVGPANAPEISLIAYSDTVHGEVTVVAGESDEIEIVAD